MLSVLPEAQAARIRDNMAKAQVKLQELIAKTPTLNNQPSYISVDSVTCPSASRRTRARPAQDVLPDTVSCHPLSVRRQGRVAAHWRDDPRWPGLAAHGRAQRIRYCRRPGPGRLRLPMNSPKLDPELDKLMKELPELDKNATCLAGWRRQASGRRCIHCEARHSAEADLR